MEWDDLVAGIRRTPGKVEEFVAKDSRKADMLDINKIEKIPEQPDLDTVGVPTRPGRHLENDQKMAKVGETCNLENRLEDVQIIL